MTSRKTVRDAMDTQIRAVNSWACRLDRLSGRTTAMSWRIRGSRKMLRRLATQLQSIRTSYSSDYCVCFAVAEYLECLNVALDDTFQEAKCRRAAQRWMAQGEAFVLSRICADLARLVQHHGPKEDGYFLSPDGKHLVSFPNDEDEPIILPVYRKDQLHVGSLSPI